MEELVNAIRNLEGTMIGIVVVLVGIMIVLMFRDERR